jgi:two-component system, chemotaxis family, CheB/CheR fusion protein
MPAFASTMVLRSPRQASRAGAMERDTTDSAEDLQAGGGTDSELLDDGPPEASPEWTALLNHLQATRGFDFHGYKPASLARRIRKRMDAIGVEGFARYQDYLEVHPDEFSNLFNTILINVTSFFRDPPAWEAIRRLAIPQIIAAKPPGESIRVWSAGCASGEEAYTLAMVLSEELGEEQFRERVKIYATDVDEDALNTARHAVFTPRQVESVPPELLEKYFDKGDQVYTFRKELRRQVIFGRHDLINDAPISRIDLLTCRNTLMYLNAETQAKVLNRLHFALNEGGFLLLGRAETLMAHGHAFVSVDLKRRLSRKGSRAGFKDRLLTRQPESTSEAGSELDNSVRQAALEASPVAQLLVDAAGQVALINDRARSLFDLRGGETGRPLRDLQISYRPVELRSLIERAEAERRPVVVREVEWHPTGSDVRWLDLNVAPLFSHAGSILGTLITFSDVSAHRQLQRELERSHQELETAYEELQSTNEELETTNEELQSTVEELETTNEELQSTNEELETMNEELQSTNEELQTMNDELRQRGEDLNMSNDFLESVLSSLKGGVAVVDRELRLLAWNAQAEELWGIRAEEARGNHFLNLDIGLPVERLKPLIKGCMGGDGGQQVSIRAVNRRGKQIQCEVHCTPLKAHDGNVHGAIVLMEESSDGQQ